MKRIPLQVIVTTTINLLVYSLSDAADATLSEKKGKQKQKLGARVDLDLLRTIERPKLPGGDTTAVFRAARYISNVHPDIIFISVHDVYRFHPQDSRAFYTVMNTNPSRERGVKSTARKGFIVRWNAKTWTVEKIRKVGDKGISAFEIWCGVSLYHITLALVHSAFYSPNGKWIAYGSSDCTIGLLDAYTLAVSLCIAARDIIGP